MNSLNYFIGVCIVLLSLLISANALCQVNNPFENATGYVNPDFAQKVQATIDTADAALADKMKIVAKQPTAVWMDSIAAIDGGLSGQRASLEQHLLQAANQASSNRIVTLLVVIYNLPNRDCAARASNGTLIGAAGLERYRRDFIDRIARLFADSRFSNLRIVAIIEPDSLPNLVTNQTVAQCSVASETGLYADGIAYALRQFSTIENVYSYLDIGHSGWLGWDNNRARAVELYTRVVAQSGSLNNIRGVVSNVSGYSPVEEALLPDPNFSIEGRPLKSSVFYEYNSQFDERDYAQVLYSDFIAAGFPDYFGVLVDTSRNGWGGAARPVTVTWNSNVDVYVNNARLDRRSARGNWCNQVNAGIGERPRFNPFGDNIIHAFVWIKPPGESDGTSNADQTTPDQNGKSFDPNCDPEGSNSYGQPTGALPNAPAAGQWFPEQFKMLVRNAHPALQ